MREVFEDEDLPPFNQQRDTEVTLGPMAVAGLIFGLLLLCGLCFGLGYSMGSHGKRAVTAGAASAAPASTATAGSAPKPEAAPQKISTAQSAAAAVQIQPSDANPAAGASSVPAGQPSSLIMVQVATITGHEDADVLVSALRNRGYAVSLSQDEGDGKFHVRVGPFASVAEANTMRQKLLNDGYNAVVQP
jgi:cell division septation protein DedD